MIRQLRWGLEYDDFIKHIPNDLYINVKQMKKNNTIS